MSDKEAVYTYTITAQLGDAFTAPPKKRGFIKRMYLTVLRDWFAGQVMIAMLTNPHRDKVEGGCAKHVFAQHCYEMADAMLAEKEKRNHG